MIIEEAGDSTTNSDFDTATESGSDSTTPSSKRRRGTDGPKWNKRAQLIFSPLSTITGDSFTLLEGSPSSPDTNLFKSRSVVVINSRSALDDDIKTITVSPDNRFPSNSYKAFLTSTQTLHTQIPAKTTRKKGN